MKQEIRLSNEGTIACISNGNCLFHGTPEDLAKKEGGMAIKACIEALEQAIRKCKNAQKEVRI